MENQKSLKNNIAALSFIALASIFFLATRAAGYNVSDFSNLANDWLKSVTTSSADLNHDNQVNATDLGIMMSKWGLIDPPVPPVVCLDGDSDGYGVCPDCGIVSNCPYEGNDCNDNMKGINPNASDVCGNGIDEDCNGADCKSTADNEKIPVLMVHGMGGNSSGFDAMRQELANAGYDSELLFAMDMTEDNSLLCSLKHVPEVDKKVEQIVRETGYDRVDVIGHSRGGLNLYNYMRFGNGANRVRNWISLAGANNNCPGLYSNPPADKTPGEKTKYTSIFSINDELAGVETRIIEGARNIELTGLSHSELKSDAKVIPYVLAALKGSGLNIDGNGQSGKIPVLMIHGLGGSSAAFDTLKQYLINQEGYVASDFYSPEMVDNSLPMCRQSQIDQIYDTVEEIAEKTGHQKIDVVGYSRGGLDIYSYMHFNNGVSRVRNWISIAGANNYNCSSVFSSLGSDKTPGSALYTSIYSDADSMVSPELARISGAKNLQVSGVSHLMMPRNSDVLKYVREALNGGGSN